MSGFARAARDVAGRLRSRAFGLLLLLTLLGAATAYQVRHAYSVEVGRADDALYLRNFHAPLRDEATGRAFRRSDAYGFVVLPGLGGGMPYRVTLGLNRGRADLPVTIIINGETFHEGSLAAGWNQYTFVVDQTHPHALASRDLVVELRAPAAGGIMLDAVYVSAADPGLVIPAWSQLFYLAALVTLAYLFFTRLAAPEIACAARGTSPLAGAAIVAVVLVGLLAAVHLPLTALTPYLTAAALAAHVLLVPVRRLAKRLAPEAHIVGRLLAHPGIWLLLAAAEVGAVAATQVRHAYDIDVGSPADQAYARNFQERDTEADGRTYRPSGVYSYLVLPGVGGSVPYSLTVTLRADGANVPAAILANGEV
ncbi:MAG TPA: hypothetical protein VM536_15845, partial [Chloroflexia bacterium]|nr:hypothetical protein [Chloroflexia bacterium]